MTQKTILIIGAGIAGLAAGCYARMNGYRARIVEQHTVPGGLCTSWRRKGYLFDGGVRYLGGTSPRSSDHHLWKELGLLQGQPIYYYPEFICFEGRDGRALHLYTQIDRLEAHLLELSPTDGDTIRDFATALRQFTRFETPVDMTPSDPLEAMQLGQQMLPVLGPVLRWQGVTVRQFAARFRDPLLREAFPSLFQFSPPDFPMMLLLTTLAAMNDLESGYPVGGSLQLALQLARRFKALGGQVRYRTRVVEVLVEEGRAVGVRLDDGTVLRADVVISAADGRSTIFQMLGGRYVDERVSAYYADLPLAQSIVQVSLGVAVDFSAEPPALDFPLRRPILVGSTPHERLVVKHYCFDPTMAPEGKSVLSVWCSADYDYWHDLGADATAYAAAKEAAADRVIGALDERFPGLRAQVEAVDVATPVTYERYTGNWRGAFAGWAMTTHKMRMMMGGAMRKTLPGLEGFYMIGQWVEPGGSVGLSAASGRDAIKDLCQHDGRPFVA